MCQDCIELVQNATFGIGQGRELQVRAVRAHVRLQIKVSREGEVASALCEVWSEALQVKGKGVWRCVDVGLELVGCRVPAFITHS